ncbi:MAG: DUF4003 family protein [Eubacterium sp.]|nr:DUF4003 family protein [Eubacterium sp.]
MNEKTLGKCNRLLTNRDVIAARFKFGHSLMNIAAALIFSGAEKEVDVEKLKQCKKLLQKNTGAFSGFQANAKPVIVSKMAISEDPEKYLEDVKAVYKKISKGMHSDNGYLVSAAAIVCDAGRAAEADEIAVRFKELYKKMNKKHPILTSSEDVVFIMLLVLTDKDIDALVDEMEECYTYMKKELKLKVSSNEIQGVSEVLALLDGDMREKSDKVVKLFNTFKAHGAKYGTSYNEFASLGALIDIDIDADKLVDEIIETADFLKENKGFGSWSMNKKQRLMFAAMLVGDAYSADSSILGNAALNSSIVAVIAEEVAMIACVVATTAASTSH